MTLAAQVRDLLPGDRIVLPAVGEGAVVFVVTDHPLYDHLQLVVWLLDSGEWSHDALDARQEVGELIEPRSRAVRQDRLRGCIGLGDLNLRKLGQSTRTG